MNLVTELVKDSKLILINLRDVLKCVRATTAPLQVEVTVNRSPLIMELQAVSSASLISEHINQTTRDNTAPKAEAI